MMQGYHVIGLGFFAGLPGSVEVIAHGGQTGGL